MTIKQYLEGLVDIYKFMEGQLRLTDQQYAADIYMLVASDVQSAIDKITEEGE